MFGKILYISDDIAYLENKMTNDTGSDLLNYHVIFESQGYKILGEIVEVNFDKIKVNFLGEYNNGRYSSGILRKPSLNSHIRIINKDELMELIGLESKENFKLGSCATYRGFNIFPRINELFSSHMCIFGNSGCGKSCGVARIIQNVLENKNSLAYNANFIFFDSFGEYKTAFQSINNINNNYSYKFITSNVKDENDTLIELPNNLLTVDDWAILLQADKHSQLTILSRALKFARIFALKSEEANKYKNTIIANAILTVLYNSDTSARKKDDIFKILETCHTNEFSFTTEIKGVGYTRLLSECFSIGSNGKFGEEVLITDYILRFATDNVVDVEVEENTSFTLEELASALDFTLISEGFNQNKNMHDDAQLLRVRLNTIIQNEVGTFFTSEYLKPESFITRLLKNNDKKAQIININLENLSDTYAKSLVKIYSRIIFDFAKSNGARATIPFHLFLEEAHRYVQKDNDVYLLGYNIFDRIAKEGRKYGAIIDIISQRPVEISDTVIAQCSNFLIFKMTHPKDIKYIEEMLPNISLDVIQKMKVLQPGTCVAFGSAFKIPMIVKMDMPDPRPQSSSCDVSLYWDSMESLINEEDKSNINEITDNNIEQTKEPTIISSNINNTINNNISAINSNATNTVISLEELDKI